MRRLLQVVRACVAPAFIVALCAVPASAAPVPVTYLNANFGPPNSSGIAFYRSSGAIQFDSATASVSAKAKNSQVEFSAYSNDDPNETSAGFSSYDIGTVNAGPGSLNVVTVSPRTLLLSGSAHFAINLWFDSSHDGEYFVWDQNEFAGLDSDVYAIGPSGSGPLTIDATTPLFVIGPGGAGGCNGAYTTTLAIINAGGCSLTIPANTHVARWVGIDIAAGSSGSGSATL